jgi:predicted RNase H-like HicB family nuclease
LGDVVSVKEGSKIESASELIAAIISAGFEAKMWGWPSDGRYWVRVWSMPDVAHDTYVTTVGDTPEEALALAHDFAVAVTQDEVPS